MGQQWLNCVITKHSRNGYKKEYIMYSHKIHGTIVKRK